MSRQVRVCRGPAEKSLFATPAAGLRARVSRQARASGTVFPGEICARAGRGTSAPSGDRVGEAVLKAGGDLRCLMEWGSCGA